MVIKIEKMRYLIVTALISIAYSFQAQVVHIQIGQKSKGSNEVTLELVNRFQRNYAKPSNENDSYDVSINSPKSVNYSLDGQKFYVQSLEGCKTVVYNAKTKKKIKTIEHSFDASNQNLFKNNETTVFDYKYNRTLSNYNIFKGKPVESCFSHNGKYLWVTYYRRDYDSNAECPSALAIIDTEKDEIVRVMPTGPLPKMIACSPDNKFIAVTHWGDNTLGVINIESENPMDFYYHKHLVVDYQMKLDFGAGHVNRDSECGYCLRGTVFTPDGDFLLVGKMGGAAGIAVFDAKTYEFLGTIKGMQSNVRHLVINGEFLYLSANTPGMVQKCSWRAFVKSRVQNEGKEVAFNEFESVSVGSGARTIVTTSDGKYLFAAVNNGSKIVVVRTKDMKVISEIPADSYPVGMDISSDDKELIVTAQGKENGGGNSVMVFKITVQ
jgi:DNA-binding beta-propeller fold protein YncE